MLHRSSVTVAATLAFAAAASAQVGSLYTFSQAVGAYTPISGGTVISTATSANTLDDVTNPVTLPFTLDRKSTRLNSSHLARSRMPSSA